ncbi:hypothetical protein QEH52_13665 [Coraliomargarita sp. SDUM461003]|uniref:Uncharacterized protein n=1 Tax=Thalassobacterium maritimum TaxID=3041265 RepID=A0ABU1B030_9BACT|nr:hypothetical protein [Coraliomargarita sp. SDUM461003]MDQ8208567.1 hypothetical protein [Coraliomargarita sp. SDUM461003]
MIISMGLMAFVLLLVLSIYTLLEVEARASGQSQAQTLARQNAYLGVLTAVGELQQALGPDSRITARSDIFAGSEALAEDSEVDQLYWMGVWNANNPDGSVKTTEDYKAWNALTPEERIAQGRWVVSGNAGKEPTDEDYWTPLQAMPEDGTTVVLAEAAEDFDVDAVRVPKVSVGSGAQKGNFAYWVSDDSAKALVNVIDPNAVDPDVELDDLNRSFQLANRNAIEVVSKLENYTPNDVSLEYLYDLNYGYGKWISDPSEDSVSVRRGLFHDLATWSKGLLVDVKDGALKRDLTQAFEIHNSFVEHFTDTAFGTQLASDQEAADPMTPEPYYFIEDPIIQNGSPNWAILRDYYRQYWQGDDGSDWTNKLSFTGVIRYLEDGSKVWKYLPRRLSSMPYSDPRISDTLPYQYVDDDGEDTSNREGDNYQQTSWLTPVVSQIRISHALEVVSSGSPDQPDVLALSFRPLFSLYNPYNVRLNGNDFGFKSTINPRITLTLGLEEGARTVEFYQSELHDANMQGTFTVTFGDFPDNGLFPGAVIHEGFGGSTFATKAGDNNADTNYTTTTWTQLGGRLFALSDFGDRSPEDADENGPVSYEEASEWKRGQNAGKQNSEHPRWGLTEDEREWIRLAVAQDASISVRIDYDSFGYIRLYTNSPEAGYGFNRIVDLWRPGGTDQPETFSTSFTSISLATVQDSFETLEFALRTTERMDGPVSDLEPIRNLVDTNIRSIFSHSMWDGQENYSRYLSLYDGSALGSNQQEPQSYTDSRLTRNNKKSKLGYFGRSVNPEPYGQKSVILFEKPRGPLLSLGQMQHANLGRYHFDPTYMLGNSYASLRIPMDEFRVSGFGGVDDLTFFDSSYLVNERVWDGFFFSTLEIPKETDDRNDLLEELAAPDADLSEYTLNPRMEFIDSALSAQERYNRIVVEDSADDNFKSAIYRPASEMWVNGAFNVNSTSVEAWKAVLSSSQGLRFPIYEPMNSHEIITEDDVSFSRFSRPFNHGFKSGDTSTEEGVWSGYRKLSSEEVTDLAESIVEQIKARGPFLSLASFVNRRLSNDELGKKGALQAALDDPTLGSDASLAVNYFSDQHVELGSEDVEPFTEFTSLLSENLADTDTTIMGLPGYVLQSDILQQIGSFLTVRSDTFTIRAYGDVVNPVTNEVTSRVLCEAKVQRVPTPVEAGATGTDEMDELIQPSSPFGRRLQIVSIKWLNEDEI